MNWFIRSFIQVSLNPKNERYNSAKCRSFCFGYCQIVRFCECSFVHMKIHKNRCLSKWRLTMSHFRNICKTILLYSTAPSFCVLLTFCSNCWKMLYQKKPWKRHLKLCDRTTFPFMVITSWISALNWLSAYYNETTVDQSSKMRTNWETLMERERRRENKSKFC